jgi:pimeloyl-ACP methyl ester carboxylesterase
VQEKEHWMNPTAYRTIQVDGLSIFYREAGPKNAETLLLLHGLPSSSRMFEPLFARLSDRYLARIGGEARGLRAVPEPQSKTFARDDAPEYGVHHYE